MTNTHITETSYLGNPQGAYRAFQGWRTTEVTSTDSTTYGIAELLSTYATTTTPTKWVAGGFIQAVTASQDDSYLTIGTTGLTFEFFGGGLSDTVASLSLSSSPSTTQTGLFPLAWLSAIHEDFQTVWQPYYDSYLNFALQEVGAGGGGSAGSLQEALNGNVFQKVHEGNSFSWVDGYSMVQYEQGLKNVTVGNFDSLEVLDMEKFQSQRQKIGEGLRGGKWPKITAASASNLTVSDQWYPSSRFEVEIPADFTTTNGPNEYNPELNFSSRRFGSKWSAVTGNQIVFGTGSGDFNLGPILNFSHYSKGAQEWSIDITDDMVKKLFSDWEGDLTVDISSSTSDPEYASDLGVSSYPTDPVVTISGGSGSGATATAVLSGNSVAGIEVNNGGSGYTSAPTVTITSGTGSGATATATVTDNAVASIAVNNGGSGYTSVPTNIDSTQLFDEVPTDEWWTTRNKLVKMGMNETYEICESGDVMFTWEKGNRRDVLIEDKEGQKRSANYDGGDGNYTYSQRDLTESESNIDGILHETRNVTSLSTSIKSGFNFSTDLTWLVGISTDEVGFTMAGPEKPYDGNKSSWKGDAYFNPEKSWQGQGITGSLNLQNTAWEINTFLSNTTVKITDPLNIRIKTEFGGTGQEAEFEFTASVSDITIALLGAGYVNATAIFGETWAKGAANKLKLTDVTALLARAYANAAPTAEMKAAAAQQEGAAIAAGNRESATGARASIPGFEMHT